MGHGLTEDGVIKHGGRVRLAARLLALALVLAPAAAGAGGFAVFDQGASATGMGNAVTALSEAPATLFYNVGGAAFFTKKDAAAGVVLRPGANVSFAEPIDQAEFQESFGQAEPSPALAHVYMIMPVAARLNAGLAVYSPFELDTTHLNPDTFPDRATATSSVIRTLDTNLSAAGRFGKLGVGVGVIVRTSTFDLARRIQTTTSVETLDFASAQANTDPQVGFGWNFGALYKPSKRLAVGFSYRSRIKINYAGSVVMTQILTNNTALDEAFANAFPFDIDLPFDTAITFPETASAGVALGVTKTLTGTFDVNWTGWSSVQAIAYTVNTVPLLDSTIPMNLQNAMTYRFGLQYTGSKGMKLRFGYAFDESPQRAADMNAVLSDTHRQTVSLGYGHDWLQVSAQWIQHLSRTSSNESFEGTVSGDAWQVAVTVKKKPKKEAFDKEAGKLKKIKL